MTDGRFVLEANRQVVGIALRVPGRFQSFASRPSVHVLDGCVFPRVKALIKRAEELTGTSTGSANGCGDHGPPSGPSQAAERTAIATRVTFRSKKAGEFSRRRRRLEMP